MLGKPFRCELVILLFLGWFGSTVFAQKRTPVNFGVDDGFPSSNVYNGIQDQEGFMWFCTDKGVVRFDGYESVVYTKESGLRHNDVWDLTLDSQNRIWLHTFGPDIQYVQNDSVHTIPQDCNFMKTSFVTEGDDQTMWILGGCGSQRFETVDGEWRQEVFKDRFLFEDGDEWWFVNMSHSNDSVYFSHYSLHHDTRDTTFHFTFKVKEMKDGRVVAFNKKPIISYNDSLFLYIDEKLVYQEQIYIEYIREITDYDNFSVIQTSKDAMIVTPELTLHQGFDFLKNYNVNEVFPDQRGNIWVTTKNRGVYLMPESDAPVAYSSDELGSNPTVTKIFEDSEGRIWFGNTTDNFHVLADDELKKVDLILGGELGEEIRDIDEAGDWIVLGMNLGLARFRKQDVFSNQKRQLKIESKLDYIPVKSFYKKEDGTFAMALGTSWYAGRFEDAEERRMNGIRKLAYHISNTGDTIVIGNFNGIFALVDNKEINLPENNIFLHPVSKIDRKKEKVWVSTQDGTLYAFKEGFEITDSIYTGQGINDFFVENDSSFWLATDVGVVHLKKEETGWKRENFSEYDGLLFSAINSVWKKGNELFVGTNKGLNILTPEGDIKRDYPKLESPKILRLEVNDKIIRDKKKLSLSYDQNRLQFYFPSLSFSYYGNLEYHYQMLPSDNKWRRLDNPLVLFSSLAPNNYTFRVKYVIPGKFDSDILEIPILIRPRLVETTGFWILCISLGLILAFGIIYLNVRRTRKKNERQRQMENRFSELELQALQAQMNPHFIFNSLGSIQHFIANGQSDNAEEYLAEFAALLRMYLEASREKFISLDREMQLLEFYVSLENMRADHHFDYRVVIDEGVDVYQCTIPSFLIQPFVENAILHGLIPKEEKGLLEINIKKENDKQYKVVVSDNGIGRRKSAEFRKNKLHQSRGMEIVEERIAVVNKIHDIDISFHIIDLPDDKGTIVELTLPINHE